MYDIPSTVLMTSHSYIWLHIHWLWHHIDYTSDITETVSVSSHPFSWWHHTHSMYDINLGVCMTSCAQKMTSHSLLLASIHNAYDITPTSSDITSTDYHITLTIHVTTQPRYLKSHRVWYHIHSTLSSHPVYVCHHSQHMCDLICTIYDLTPTLYDITPLYLWRHIHCVL